MPGQQMDVYHQFKLLLNHFSPVPFRSIAEDCESALSITSLSESQKVALRSQLKSFRRAAHDEVEPSSIFVEGSGESSETQSDDDDGIEFVAFLD
jgi:hypothetical protein